MSCGIFFKVNREKCYQIKKMTPELTVLEQENDAMHLKISLLLLF